MVAVVQSLTFFYRHKKIPAALNAELEDYITPIPT